MSDDTLSEKTYDELIKLRQATMYWSRYTDMITNNSQNEEK